MLTDLDLEVEWLFQFLTDKKEPEVEIAAPPQEPGIWVAGKLITTAAATKFIETANPERPEYYLKPEYLPPRALAWLRRNEGPDTDLFFPTCHRMRLKKVKTDDGTGFVLAYLTVSPRLGRKFHLMDGPLQQRFEELLGVENDPIQWYSYISTVW
ncbi:hypothetical protein K438DRAFT_2018112 [Mycena galopus ATCC 62051]|nr:hypothetical protein K438DRAFT_2018112 [Mycena galopus ATCC 62051]